MNRLELWLRLTFGLHVDWYCMYKRVGRAATVRTCACANRINDHNFNHLRCAHCTNPAVTCGTCGVGYLDKTKPNDVWWVFTLWGGWRHRRCLSMNK